MTTEIDKIDLEKFLEDPENRRLLEKIGKLGVDQAPEKPQIKGNTWNSIHDVVKSKMNKPGVYIFRSTENDLVYVGETGDTKEAGMANRMQGHLSSPSNSNLNVMLMESDKFPQYKDDPLRVKKELKSFKVYFWIVENKEERRKTEAALIDLLRPLCPFLLNK